MVLAGAVQLHMPPVEEKSPVGGELRRAESEPLRNALNNVAAGYYLGNQRVQLRGLDIQSAGESTRRFCVVTE